MTIDTDLPTLNYLHVHDPEEAHRAIAEARRRAPIALGALGPEVLTYDLVRAVLRDPRFAAAHRPAAEVQGINEGPLWQRITTLILAIDGERHHRQRRLVAKAFTPRATARLEGLIVEIITELVDPHLAVGRCDVVSDVARQFPIPIICAPPESACSSLTKAGAIVATSTAVAANKTTNSTTITCPPQSL
jgi:cytochrome P450